MSYLDHIAACNNHRPGRHKAFMIDGIRLGHIGAPFEELLRGFPDVFTIGEDITLSNRLVTYDERSQTVAATLGQLRDKGLALPWRSENYPVVAGYGDEAFFELERSAVPRFGVRAFGVHLNGFVRRTDGGIDMWIARRSADRAICPGMLDNMVAGGQPVGLSLMENVVKECGEEANIPPDLASQAIPVGAISYVMEVDGHVKPDTMFCYDLEVPDDFVPENTDGEAAGFTRYPVEEVAAIVEFEDAFKFNCNLVIIDFLIRHGIIPPEHADYMALLRGLHQ